MTGRPDTTDPLDFDVTAPLRIAGVPPGIIDFNDFDVTDEVLAAYPALVAVARAAREIVEAQTGPRWKRLAEELARLDGAR